MVRVKRKFLPNNFTKITLKPFIIVPPENKMWNYPKIKRTNLIKKYFATTTRFITISDVLEDSKRKFFPFTILGKNKTHLILLIRKSLPNKKESHLEDSFDVFDSYGLRRHYSVLEKLNLSHPNEVVGRTGLQRLETEKPLHYRGMCVFWVIWFSQYIKDNPNFTLSYLYCYALNFILENGGCSKYISYIAKILS